MTPSSSPPSARAVGKAPNGTLRGTRPDELAARRDRRGAAPRAGPRPGRRRRRDPRVRDAGGRAGPERRAHREPARRHSGAARRRSRSTASARRACRRSRTPPSASCAASPSAIVAGGTESMSLVPMGGNKIAPNPTLVDSYPGRLPEHGARRREPRARDRHLARGAGRVRAAQPPARARRDRRRPLRRRDRAGHGRDRRRPNGDGSRESRESTFAVGRRPRRDTSLEALAKLRPAFHVARHGHRRQLVADERRRRRGHRHVAPSARASAA